VGIVAVTIAVVAALGGWDQGHPQLHGITGALVLSALQAIATAVSYCLPRATDWQKGWERFAFWLQWTIVPCVIAAAMCSKLWGGSQVVVSVVIAGAVALVVGLVATAVTTERRCDER
jgi:hypothetical protein